MAVTTVIGSIIKYIDAENQTIIRPKTTDSAVSVDRGSNANVPSSATDLNKLVAALGSLAFKSGIAAATPSVAGLMSAADKTKLDGIETGANKYVHPTTSGNKHIPTGGSEGKILRWSADGTAVWGDDKDTTYTVFKGASASAAGGTGLVPAPAQNQQTRFLRADGTWQVPANTTYNVFGGANGSAGGSAGLVPAPGAADNYDLLCGDGTWKAMSDTMVVANSAPAYSCIWIQTEA